MAVEYLIGNPGELPNSWADTPIGVDPPTPLIGFTIGIRPYTLTLDEPPVREYPNYWIKSQTLVVSDPTPPVYTTNTGTELFTAPVTPENSPILGTYSTAGITDGTAYSYGEVFDQTDFRYIETDYVPPPAPPAVDGSIPTGNIPLQPYDPSAGIYPYGSITTFLPDVRDLVTVTYTLTTKYSLSYNGSEITVVASITQDVLQTITDWSDTAKFYGNREAYVNGLIP